MNTQKHTTDLDKRLEANRHGLICMIILIVGCMGGVATGFRAVENVLLLSIVVIPTMTTLSLLLAVAPMKWILRAAVITVLVDIFVLLYYFFL
jgi:hypothetical protein